MVVKDGKIHRVNVKVGMDTGLRAEIVHGLAENDQVILQPDPSIADGNRRPGRSRGSRPLKNRLRKKANELAFRFSP